MKNILFILFGFVLLGMFSACNELDDVYDELDAEQGGLVLDVEYTLTDDDYKLVERSYGNFNDTDQAKELIPTVLEDVFPYVGNSSSVVATYKIYNGSSPYIGDTTEYTVTEDEYDALGYGYGNFDDLGEDLPTYANYKVANPSNGDLLLVTHQYYNNGESTVTSAVTYTVAYGWVYAMELPLDAYGDFFYESGTDFSSSDEGLEKMPVYLNEYHSRFVDAGSILAVIYLFDDRYTDSDNPGLANTPDVGLYIFNGTEWLLYGDAYQVTSESLQFALEESVWVPDNTIKYELTSADYSVCGDEANGLGNSAARENLRTYGNFGTQWSHAEIIDAISFVLKLNFPDSEEGQKIVVTYDTYPAGTITSSLILDASGDYIEITE